MHILAIADTWEFELDQAAEAPDILVSCGDIPEQFILSTADACGCGTILAVKGNHGVLTF